MADAEMKSSLTTDASEENQQLTTTISEVLQLTVESKLPIEDLRKLYTSPPNIANLPASRQDEIDTSEEDSSDGEGDSGYQRLLIAENSTLNDNGDDEDADGSSFTFYWQKAINIGEQYQAVVPDLVTSSDLQQSESPDDQLIWSPPSDTNADEDSPLIQKYLKSAAKEHRTADQEVVLEILLASDFDMDQALDKLRLPSTNKNYFSPTAWTLAECDQFEQCFKDYGKDFSMFKIPDRNVKELIFFYYIWKKSARHDVFVRQNRVEKRRFHLHPYVTDYLEKFFAEQELQLTNAYEQNNASLLTSSNPQLSADQLMSKRRLSSELFLKPNATVKRTKSSLPTHDQDPVKHATDSPDLSDPPSTTIRTSSPTLNKKLSDETK